MHLLNLLLRWERILLSLHRLTLLREWCLLLITTLHRLLLVALLHRLLLITLLLVLSINFPSSKIVKPLARILRPLMSVCIKMNSYLLTYLQRELLNLSILNVKDETLWILATLMLDNITCTAPLVSALTDSRLNWECKNDSS